MSDKITAALIRAHGAALRRIELDEQRAAEVAAEVERLNNAVLDAARRIDFNDEPARFPAYLASVAHAGKAPK